MSHRRSRVSGTLEVPWTNSLLTSYAVLVHDSACDLGESLETTEGTDAYLAEAIELFKEQLGATEVIAWNSVIRSNVPDAGEPL